MEKQLEQHYERMFAMFASEAWQDLMEDVEKVYTANNNIFVIQSEQELHFKKGQLDVLQWFRSMKSSYERSYEELKTDSSGEARDA
jgi:hypothetical protein